MAPFFHLSLSVPGTTVHIYFSLFNISVYIYNFFSKQLFFSSVQILNSPEYISFYRIPLELEITVEHDENVGRSTCNLDEVVVDTYFLSWWKMYAFTLSQNNLYCDLCFIIYVLDIMHFWQFFPVSDRFYFLFRSKEDTHFCTFFHFCSTCGSISLITQNAVICQSVFTKYLLRFSMYTPTQGLTFGKRARKEKEKDYILNCCKWFNLCKSTLKIRKVFLFYCCYNLVY